MFHVFFLCRSNNTLSTNSGPRSVSWRAQVRKINTFLWKESLRQGKEKLLLLLVMELMTDLPWRRLMLDSLWYLFILIPVAYFWFSSHYPSCNVISEYLSLVFITLPIIQRDIRVYVFGFHHTIRPIIQRDIRVSVFDGHHRSLWFIRIGSVFCINFITSILFRLSWNHHPSSPFTGYPRNRGSKGGFGHHSHRRQFHKYRASCNVGTKRLRQHLKVYSVPAHCQLGRHLHCCHRRSYFQGKYGRSNRKSRFRSSALLPTAILSIECI